MDLMSSIAAQSMEMKASEFQQNYSIAVTKKAMDAEEMAAKAILEMMPSAPAKGQYVDVYA